MRGRQLISGFLQSGIRTRKPALTVARLVCCLFAVAGVSLPRYSPTVSPLFCMPWLLVESEGTPVEESESSTAEATGVEHLIRCDGRRHVSRPVAIAGSLLPVPGITTNRGFCSLHDCPPTEHALRDGLGAPLRI
jgi:hypothetical protein